MDLTPDSMSSATLVFGRGMDAPASARRSSGGAIIGTGMSAGGVSQFGFSLPTEAV